jgi:glyoxylase-like metal-dependent hydrolase (beta-lactamase superfamily II)
MMSGTALHSGRAKVHVLELGQLSCPGTVIYGGRSGWESFHRPDSKGMVRFPTRVVLARFPSRTLLVDCGYGIDFCEQLSREFLLTREPFLARALDQLGVLSVDVTDVVLTHSHFDHALGAIHQGAPTFPKARYHIQKAAWADASDLRWKSHLLPHINLLNGDTEIFPGVRGILTGGHSAGHQAVLIEKLLFLADICPSRFHLDRDCVMDYDVEPVVTKRAKKRLLGQAAERGWTLAFSHDPERGFV